MNNLANKQGTTSVFKSKSKRGFEVKSSTSLAPNAYNPKPLEKKSSTLSWFRDTVERFPLKNEYSGKYFFFEKKIFENKFLKKFFFNF